MTTPNTKDVYIFFHGNCSDGITAAAITYNHYNTERVKRANMNFYHSGSTISSIENTHPIGNVNCIPVTYNDKLDVSASNIQGADVVFVDFCPSAKVGFEVAKRANSITIIDHHKPSPDKFKELQEAVEEAKEEEGMKPCPITLFFHGGVSGAAMCSDLFLGSQEHQLRSKADFANRYDLWLHKGDNTEMCAKYAQGVTAIHEELVCNHNPFKDSKRCSAGIFLDLVEGGDEVIAWYANQNGAIEHVVCLDVTDIIEKGDDVIKNMVKQAKRIIKEDTDFITDYGEVEGSVQEFIAFSYNVSGKYVNEVSNQLFTTASALPYVTPIIASVCIKPRGDKIKLSMRVAEGCDIDANAVMAVLGGGGHVKAAGALIERPDYVSNKDRMGAIREMVIGAINKTKSMS